MQIVADDRRRIVKALLVITVFCHEDIRQLVIIKKNVMQYVKETSMVIILSFSVIFVLEHILYLFTEQRFY